MIEGGDIVEKQNFKNHVRFHIPYHVIGNGLLLFIVIGSVWNFIVAMQNGSHRLVALIVLAMAGLLGVSFGLVRLYSMKVQDRVIRVEENFRYYRLTGEVLPSALTTGQIIALRFASDEEFLPLVERAMKEQLKPVEIKKSIKNWREDHLRV